MLTYDEDPALELLPSERNCKNLVSATAGSFRNAVTPFSYVWEYEVLDSSIIRCTVELLVGELAV